MYYDYFSLFFLGSRRKGIMGNGRRGFLLDHISGKERERDRDTHIEYTRIRSGLSCLQKLIFYRIRLCVYS